jgi:hypothetical protein
MPVRFPHQPGDRVRHPWFGTGTVRDVGERYIAVVFDEGGEALVKIDDADLEPEDGYPGALPEWKEDAPDETNGQTASPEPFDSHVFEPGDRVEHFKFKEGTVLSTEFSKELKELAVKVRFDRDDFDRTILANRLVRTALADQDWPVDTFSFENEEAAPHAMGSHWEPFGGLKPWFERLGEILQGEHPKQRFRDANDKGCPRIDPSEWPVGYVAAWPDEVKGLCTVHSIDLERKEVNLESLFPFFAEGARHTMTLEEVCVWNSGYEAHIIGTLGEAEIIFYDTAYLPNRAWYKIRQHYDFTLTGLAYSARPAPYEPFTVRQDPEVAAWIARMRREQGEEVLPGLEPIFSMKGMASLLPIEEWDRDDYTFRGPVLSVREVEMLDEPAWLLEVTVLRFSGDLNLNILVTRRVWEGERPPQVGEDVEGRLWLQGYMALAHAWRDSLGRQGPENPAYRPG